MKLKKFLYIPLFIFIFITFYFIVIFTLNTIYDYVPFNKVKKLSASDTLTSDTINILSWNIGYAGMGEKMDFFYDGGKNVYPDYKYYIKCRDSIGYILSSFDKHVDFCLLQEVDFYSKRSYFENQKQFFHKFLKNKLYSDSLINYKVFYIPFPLFKPLGKVTAGLVTFSNKRPTIKLEYYFGETYSWPKQIFFLDRGMLIHAFQTHKKKLLYVVNIHLSAFDDAAIARTKELIVLKKIISEILKNNHYLIVAGDWNINPPDFNFTAQNDFPIFYTEKNAFKLKGTYFYYDSITPTNRKADKPFIYHNTPVTTIDYILVSNNIEIINFKCLNFNFRYSDHNPILFTIFLK